MARRTTWLIDMGDGTWAVSCMACRIALFRGPKAGADRAAARLHVTGKTVTRWASEGRLEHRRTLGGHRRYDPALSDALGEALTYRP